MLARAAVFRVLSNQCQNRSKYFQDVLPSYFILKVKLEIMYNTSKCFYFYSEFEGLLDYGFKINISS